jgi:hypothetical protein
MHDSLQRGDPGDPSMERIVGAESPTGQPHQHIVSHTKQPYQWEICKRDDSCSIRDISQQLTGLIRPIQVAVCESIVCAAQNYIQNDEGGNRECLSSRWDRTPPKRPRAAVTKRCRYRDVSLQPNMWYAQRSGSFLWSSRLVGS